MIPLSVDSDGMPSFAQYRTLCDALTAYARKGSILACRQASPQTLAAMSDPSIVRALLIESTEALPFTAAKQAEGEDFWNMACSEAENESK